jgi:hypothetical protein
MARDRTIKISGINLRVHSKHAPSEYVELWKAFTRLRKPKTRGVSALMIGTQRPLSKEDPASPIFGYLYRFVNIDPSDPWFDIEKHGVADDDDVAQVRIPAKLKPNLEEIPYLLDTKRHRFFFKSGGVGAEVSPGIALSLIEHLAQYPSISERFGEVDATIITEKGTLRQLLSWPVLKQISVTLKRPNPNEFDDDQEFYARLERRGLKLEEHKFVKAPEAETITPDEEMVAMFNRAIEDGTYTQRGVDEDGELRTASASEYPMKESFTYDPDHEVESEMFVNFAKSL